ncbi:ionic transporter y4hA [Chryseobacterium soli]|uniref:Ionic transporter y4hA n=1 Tax=Chryseobacterium soli TaxID=445961 RepID=A0A086ABY1_9FLAO|nr:ionic transporter y4hA [Chryseobacterium soli]KFF14195.1 ionic transporter y4hA [Chryseobacterium soli]MDV7696778.1 ionic transporter y4hA [Chryseobacterium soli]
MRLKEFLHYTYIFPVLAVVYYFSGLIGNGVVYDIIAGLLLTGSVLSAVHHAEVVAHKVGEPFGTIILALCITIIEVALIISLMVAGGDQAITLARDTVFAAVMIILNGIIGICILIGGVKYYEQFFARTSATTYLVSIVSILILTLVLPNFTSSVNGPFYNTAQLIFVSIACLVIYGVFLMVQTVRHRNYFIITDEDSDSHYIPTKMATIISFIFLVICLVIVVLMAKGLSGTIEDMVRSVGAPKSLVGVIIAAVVLLPEGVAAIRAARSNQIQSSLNLALGSALASIGLTIPAVSIVCIMYDIPFVLGLDKKDIILLSLSVFIVMLSLSRGKTNILYGTVLLVNLAAYIFTVIVP